MERINETHPEYMDKGFFEELLNPQDWDYLSKEMQKILKIKKDKNGEYLFPNFSTKKVIVGIFDESSPFFYAIYSHWDYSKNEIIISTNYKNLISLISLIDDAPTVFGEVIHKKYFQSIADFNEGCPNNIYPDNDLDYDMPSYYNSVNEADSKYLQLAKEFIPSDYDFMRYAKFQQELQMVKMSKQGKRKALKDILELCTHKHFECNGQSDRKTYFVDLDGHSYGVSKNLYKVIDLPLLNQPQ